VPSAMIFCGLLLIIPASMPSRSSRLLSSLVEEQMIDAETPTTGRRQEEKDECVEGSQLALILDRP